MEIWEVCRQYTTMTATTTMTTMTTMTLTALLNIIANAEANAAFAANAGHKLNMLPGGLNDKRRGNTRNNGYAKQHMSKGRTANITSRHRYNYQNRNKIR
jgi:hypothetical protein